MLKVTRNEFIWMLIIAAFAGLCQWDNYMAKRPTYFKAEDWSKIADKCAPLPAIAETGNKAYNQLYSPYNECMDEETSAFIRAGGSKCDEKARRKNYRCREN